ncbi:hypothetical protein H9W91_23290 [Streptomyces alfalfae]|uniref:hypothetical protein n=2 Tax=Streptomyces alfalfae TaxID=1642299 RepID=UPI001BAC246B|nr:hypothetical protein [Streptomyces alfalfae]QUI33460.1 hypothetical protein H9W91_23290 [Streptomyces alfalfae]
MRSREPVRADGPARAFDPVRQEWQDTEEERRIAGLHERDAARQRTALHGVLAVLAACSLAFGVWALGWKDEPGPVAYRGEWGPSREEGGGAGSTASPSPTGALPADYEEVTDLQGYRLAVPRGWEREQISPDEGHDVVNYRSPDGARRLQVYQVGEATPYDSLREYLKVSSVRKAEGYEQISFGRLERDGLPAARLEHLTDRIPGEREIGIWHVIDQRFEAFDGRLYAVAAYGAEADGRADEEELLTTALTWFCPPFQECPTPGT